ncbi:MAG: sialate O-acetylesterase [Akkermansiaceae bacterium]|nr:sialate O-acetylesterase [Akkermansiaceae bacterium]
MKTPPSRTVSIVAALSLALAPAGYTAEIIPITSFDPTTFFEGVTAGFDFDGVSGPTQSGFTSIAPAGTGTTTYHAVNNGITLDLTISNFNATAHRNRNKPLAGNLVTDFAQWYHTTNANAEAAFSFTGLNPNTDHDISFFVFNLGAGQMTHKFYEGTSSADPLITTFTTSGNENNYSTWSPGITFRINSGASGRIAVTMQEAGSRLNMDGIAITRLATPAAPPFNLVITPNAAPGLYDFQWNSQAGKVYDLLTSTDLATPTAEWPIYNDGETLHKAIPSAGETTTLTAVPCADPRRFFAVREYDAPPPPIESELSSVWGSGTTVTLNFTEKLDETTATDPRNYQVFNLDVFWVVASAALSADGKTVTLTLESPLPIDTTFSVSLSNLTSSDGTPLVGSTTAQFQTWDNDPDGVKVFILAGQSNMVGYGHTETGNGGIAGAIGSLRHLAVNNASFPAYDYASLLVNPADPANSAWKTRGDVKAWWKDGGTELGGTVRKGDLGPPFLGSDTSMYGPEFAFGQVMGDYYLADDVLVIKAAWGGKSLAVDFRPPSAVARVPGTQVGPFYRGIFDNVREVLTKLGTEFPQWSGTGYQIVGFGWHQGWNDRVNQTYNDEYEANMKNFIDDVRSELGQPELPFVIATTGMAGWAETHPRALSLMNAQLAMKDFTKYPAFEGNVDVIDTRDFWRDATVSPADQGYHWNQNGETLFLIGKSMGDRMVGLLETAD